MYRQQQIFVHPKSHIAKPFSAKFMNAWKLVAEKVQELFTWEEVEVTFDEHNNSTYTYKKVRHQKKGHC